MKNIIARILLTIALAVAAALALTNALDNRGEAYTENTLKRALASYGIARGLNGVISVAQEFEVAFSPAGIGLTLKPGEILDPVNDLIERFSWVMLASSASLGIQKILLEISAWHYFSYLTVVIFAIAAIVLWLPVKPDAGFRELLVKLALVMVFLRFSVPVIAISSELAYLKFLSPQYTAATEQLQQTTRDIGLVNHAIQGSLPNDRDSSILGKARELYKSATESVDIDSRIEQYKEAAADVSESTIDLLVVFVFQTIIFPLGFLFGGYVLMKALLRGRILGESR